MSNTSSVLIIGASGGTGLQIMKHLSALSNKPTIHAFCRTPSKLDNNQECFWDTAIEGDATKSGDIQHAIEQTDADVVVLSIGNGDNVGKTSVRQQSGMALAKVLTLPQFHHVNVVVISSIGSGNSKIKVGLGIGQIIKYHLRHILKDHTLQENAFHNMKNRTLIVRATALKDGKGNGKYHLFDGIGTPPTIEIDRSDVGCFVVDALFKEDFPSGIVHITGSKK